MLALFGRIGIAAHRDHFVRRLSVRPSVCLSVRLFSSHAFLVVTHSYVSQATRAFLGMLPLCLINDEENSFKNEGTSLLTRKQSHT